MVREISRKIVTSRKRFQCDLCSCWIEKGEKYIRSTCEDNGEIYTFKSHIDCDRIIGKLDDEFDEHTIQDGVDSNTFEACIDDYIRNHHYNKDVIEDAWNVPLCKQVKMILNEV